MLFNDYILKLICYYNSEEQQLINVIPWLLLLSTLTSIVIVATFEHFRISKECHQMVLLLRVLYHLVPSSVA